MKHLLGQPNVISIKGAYEDSVADHMVMDLCRGDCCLKGENFTDVVGSPYYIAPEVLNKDYSLEADIWSASVMIYMLQSGLAPFWGRRKRKKDIRMGVCSDKTSGEPLNIEAYAARYKGRTKIIRLLFIAKHLDEESCHNQALKMPYYEIKKVPICALGLAHLKLKHYKFAALKEKVIDNANLHKFLDLYALVYKQSFVSVSLETISKASKTIFPGLEKELQELITDNPTSLIDLAFQKVAGLIEGKIIDKIRETFNVKNDLTPEEEERVRKENRWAFE
ncbi:hypothetical protein BRARA_C01802 [Brassica rapa]|uniref:Protein kinase domain-containing protein n=1 Tax=Brassica campestris TaxID=3711 RepID=A0A397ZX53_BRACM|nr:hypothetical protein BRARA_C01802 [Brassica rapa]